MCWYSANHADEILQAEAGQRLGIRKVHGCSWAVRESDLHKLGPTPVCLIDRTTVLFRFPELEEATLRAVPATEAVFRMLTAPKRDVFQFPDGHEVGMNMLPADLIFDVLDVPGKEEFSGLHKDDGIPEAASEPRPLLERILQLF